jgi:hypothetical protein
MNQHHIRMRTFALFQRDASIRVSRTERSRCINFFLSFWDLDRLCSHDRLFHTRTLTNMRYLFLRRKKHERAHLLVVFLTQALRKKFDHRCVGNQCLGGILFYARKRLSCSDRIASRAMHNLSLKELREEHQVLVWVRKQNKI